MTGGDRCSMPTGNGFTFCSRRAVVFFLREPTATAPDGRQVAAYCRQHANGSGKAALLRPLPWEYDYRYDRVNGTFEQSRVARKGGQS